jgi:hypothetical protein
LSCSQFSAVGTRPFSLSVIPRSWPLTSTIAAAMLSSVRVVAASVVSRLLRRLSSSRLQARNAAGQLRDLVHDHDAGHHGDPEIADLAELILEMADIAVETGGEIGQVIFLPLLAGHAIGLAVDRYRYLRHIISPSLAVENRTDRLHRRHQPPRDLAIDLFQPVRAELGLVELLRQLRAIGVHAPHLALDLAGLALAIEPRVNGIVETRDCLPELRERCVDGVCLWMSCLFRFPAKDGKCHPFRSRWMPLRRPIPVTPAADGLRRYRHRAVHQVI